MNEEKKDRRIRRTKKQLEDALLTLLRTKNIHNITVSELASTADVTRATFYAHYRDPQDMLIQMQKRILDNIFSLIDEDTSKHPDKFFLATFEYFLTEVAHPEILFITAGERSAFEEFGNIIFENYILHWVPNITNDSRIYEYYRTYTIYGCVSVVRHWLNTGKTESPETMAALFLQLLPGRPEEMILP
ncbi:MAG: TetR/AcrR family transcriptional regulator [Lachnospiraceae bacterium]|nr:TetR/AcrR family transcriptional regulator [Lachnospiraceae bacterium]